MLSASARAAKRHDALADSSEAVEPQSTSASGVRAPPRAARIDEIRLTIDASIAFPAWDP